ncbi:MAG: hypothetical protein ACREJS_13170 [Candidatus Rokuibacteriota bacterium]
MRRRIPRLDEDRRLETDLEVALALCADGSVLHAVESAVGRLA